MKYVMRRTKTLSSSAVESGTTVSLDQGDILEVKLDLSESQQVSVIAKLVKVSESLEGTPINSVVLQIIALKPEDHDRVGKFLNVNTAGCQTDA